VTGGDQPASGVRRRLHHADSVDGPPAKGDRLSTFVLVHGAGAGGWIWKKVIPLLRAAGHEVYAPTLTGCGERAHLNRGDIGLDTHVRDVVGTLVCEELAEVILVGHSYGGNVITGVADRAPDRLAQLVYLDANVPRDGESLVDLMGQEPQIFRERAALRGAQWRHRNPALPELPAAEAPPTAEGLTPWVARGLLTAAERDWLLRHFGPHPAQTYLDPVRLRHPAALALPRAYIYCTLTGGPFATFAARAKVEPGWRYRELVSGHAAQVMAPRALADLLLGLRSPAT
jgi:pimeloyl-ACP methyl ester carboxylesterase